MVARRLEGLGAILVQLALSDRFHYFFQLVGRVFSYLAQNVGVALKCLLFSFRLLIEISNEQIDNLIACIQENYAPLSLGENSYISLSDDNLSMVLRQVTGLGLSDEGMVDKLYESGVLTTNLSIAITAAERKTVIQEFERNIPLDNSESFWQDWFGQQKWILGSDHIKILTERTIDEHHIADKFEQGLLSLGVKEEKMSVLDLELLRINGEQK